MEVNSDIFDELLKPSQVSFSAFTEDSNGEVTWLQFYIFFRNVLFNSIIHSFCNLVLICEDLFIVRPQY